MSGMSFVVEGLYLGNVDDACKTQDLHDRGVTHIFTIDARPLSRHMAAGFQYKYLHALDMESSDLLTHFPEAIAFVDEGRQAGGVLVHCYVGQSCSATMVLAYLMSKLDLNLDDAKTILMKQRPMIRPNHGFVGQLELFEAMGNCLDRSNEQYKLYRLNNLALRMQTAQCRDTLLNDYFTNADEGTGAADVVYKCKKCRRPLFKSSSLLPHNEGRGEAAFDWRSNLPSLQRCKLDYDDADVISCHQSIFTEPIGWMADSILALEGKLGCPKCQAKLGSFNWVGERCPCGTWVTPAFHIQKTKVDECRPSTRIQPPVPGPPLPPRPGTMPVPAVTVKGDADLPLEDAVSGANTLQQLDSPNGTLGTGFTCENQGLPPL